MELTRREALQKIATGTASAVAVGGAVVALPPAAEASEIKHAPPGALGLLVIVGRRWMTKKPSGAATPTVSPADDDYSEKLADELSETD